MTQCEMVLKFLEEEESITQIQALNELGIMRLASRISDLKKQGYKIKKKMITKPGRWQKKVTFAQYSLE